jgi:lysozyme family protein
MSIDTMIDATIGKEGGYSNNPADTGGATRWGITERVARANGYSGDMKLLPRETAFAIYKAQYAIKPGFAAVAAISPAIGEELFDTGVNMGPAIPAVMFQKALNGLNNQARDYPDLKEDGDIGPASLAALKAFLAKRGKEGESVLLKALNCLQGERYIELARGRPANETFLYGWLRSRVA